MTLTVLLTFAPIRCYLSRSYLLRAQELCESRGGRQVECQNLRAQELCEREIGRPGLPVPNSPCGLTFAPTRCYLSRCCLVRAQELCESRGGRP